MVFGHASRRSHRGQATASHHTSVAQTVIDCDGRDLFQDLQQIRTVPGIAVTACGMTREVQRSHDVGFVAHITKPHVFESPAAAYDDVGPEGTVPSGANNGYAQAILEDGRH